MFSNEFIDIRFGNHWASEFNLVVVSSSDRYSPPMFGSVDANTTTLAGKRGVYKWKTRIAEKTFTVKIAYDNLQIEHLPIIKNWLDPEKVDRLVFSDEPYKFYYAAVSQDPQLTFVPFLNGEFDVGSVTYQKGVLKGEMTITFVCIDNYAYSEYETFTNPNLVYMINEGDETTAPANDIYYYNLITDTILTDDARKKGEDYVRLNIDNPTNYFFNSEIEYAAQEFDFEDETVETRYNMLLNEATNGNAGSSEGFKPWVRMSNLLDFLETNLEIDGQPANFYNNYQIYSKSIYSAEPNLKVVANYLPGFKLTTAPIYLLNSGNAPANLIMAFKFDTNMDEIKIKIDKVFINKEKDFTGPLSWTTKEDGYSEIILTSPKKYRPYQDFLAVEGRNTENLRIVIDTELCEVFLVDTEIGDRLNLSRFNKNQSFLTLASCNFIDYSKPFPTSNIEIKTKDSALRRTVFNRLTSSVALEAVDLKWKHTYL